MLSRFVKRKWDLLSGAVAVDAVDESHAVQCGEGDILVLKGHLYEGNFGNGAVHKSPDIETEWGITSSDLATPNKRLLLTVDDSNGNESQLCSCC